MRYKCQRQGNARHLAGRLVGFAVGYAALSEIQMSLPVLFAAASLMTASALACAETRYRVTDIGALIDPTGVTIPSRATGIDARGRVVGTGAPGAPGNGFWYAAGKVHELTLGYPQTVPGKMSPGGRSAGDALKDSSSTREAFRFDGGDLIPLGNEGFGYARGNDVNDKKVVVGYVAPSESSASTFMRSWDKSGASTPIPTIGGAFGRPFGINSKGWIVGESDTGVALQGRHAFLRVDGTTTDLGVLASGDGSVAYAINEAGDVVVGSSLISVYRSAGIHAFRWEQGQMQDLGTLSGLDSAALDVNSGGTIVGYSLVKVPHSNIQASHGFVYRKGKMKDLNKMLAAGDEKYLIYSASAINDAGQIAASGVELRNDGSSSYDKALLLTPESDSQSQSPYTPR